VLSLRYGGAKQIDDDTAPRGGFTLAIWRSTLAKTAVEVAAARVAADDSLDFDEVRDEIFAYLDEAAKADDAQYEGDGSDEKSSSKRSGKTGGSKGKGSKNGKGGKLTLSAAKDMELNFGAFEGVTLGELVDIDTEKAEEDFDYGDGERDGRDYLSWLASDRNKNEFARARAQLVADDAGIEYDS
jgi:hypothetical protein